MLLAQIFGTLMNVTTRLLEIEGNNGKGMHPFQILFARMGITFILATSYMYYKRTPDFPLGKREVRWLLVARGFGGFFGVFGMYYSLLYLPLADATVITFLAPGLACWACSILINEPFGRIEIMATCVSLVGVGLIAKPTALFAAFASGAAAPPASGTSDAMPSFNGTAPASRISDASNYDNVTPMQRLTAIGAALLGVCGAVTAFTTIRWIGKRAHPLISVNYFAAWCTLVATVMMLVLPGVGFLLPANLKEWGYLFFLGICGFIMVRIEQIYLTTHSPRLT
jgi:drug/metabolite transporter (DMT)-like permease